MTKKQTVKPTEYFREAMPVKKTHGMPALLSFFIPGLGQLVKGQVIKGILYFLAIVVTMPTIILPFVIWIACVVDAYKS